MSIRLVFVMCLAVFLYGCESTEEIQDEVTIEDQGRPVDANGSADSESDTQAYGAEEDSSTSMSALDDPNSPLSTRIIYFEYDSSDVQQEYRPVVEAHAKFLAANSGQSVTLEGHADERGSREYNLALGERRAESIKQQMTLLGASANQIRIVSYGEERPAVDGHDDYAWSQNRRVEILYQ